MFYEALQLNAYTFCIVSIYHYEMVLFILSNIHYFLLFGHLMDFSALPDSYLFLKNKDFLASVAPNFIGFHIAWTFPSLSLLCVCFAFRLTHFLGCCHFSAWFPAATLLPFVCGTWLGWSPLCVSVCDFAAS